ncbi:MAG: chromosome condensation regulator RCC1 [Haliea sp.]|nr:MAG: chromosome condensation regulator RCC1 [Haliea sp.]
MKRVQGFMRAIPALGVAALLAACGGGGGGDSGLSADPVAPTLSATALPNPVVQQSRLSITGTASDDQALRDVVVSVNGVTTTATLTLDAFQADISLKAGSNTYAVTATDTAGNQRSVTGTVYFGHRVAAGGANSAALVNGQLYAWGQNHRGQAGIGQTTELGDAAHPVTPRAINTTVPFVALSSKLNHVAAVDANGEVWTWGESTDGQLGQGATASCGGAVLCSTEPGKVAGLSNVVSVATGYDHTLALDAAGSVWAFGLNTLGQLGNGTSVSSNLPVKVTWNPGDAATVGRIVQVMAGSASSYALDDKGQVWAWGRNQYGNLGQSTQDMLVHATPVLVTGLAGVRIRSIAGGRDHVLALADTGVVYGWGLNASSQVGYNQSDWPDDILTPRALPTTQSGPRVLEVYANGNVSFIKRDNGLVYAWGQYDTGGGSYEGPTAFAELADLRLGDLAVGVTHRLALTAAGGLVSWGWSFEGSLGIADAAPAFEYPNLQTVSLSPVP